MKIKFGLFCKILIKALRVFLMLVVEVAIYFKESKKNPHISLLGMDIVNKLQYDTIEFHQANITAMAFKDKEFDMVICTHTIEHILELRFAIQELVRITNRQLIIVTPCQRYFYYTLDEHVNFFHKKEMLTSLLPFTKFICKKINFDWVYIGNKNS